MKAEKRFLSTIARRLDTLGAITRGERQTGGQGLFRPEDNLESHYARDALRQLYMLFARGKVEGCSLQMFEDATGLKLTDDTGVKDELPPITTFLNRLLALTIELQGVLFTAFEQLLNARIEGAIASGSYDVGLETLRAESFVVTCRQTIHVHPGTGAEAGLLTITQRQRNRPVTLDEALDQLADPRAKLLINERSGRAAVQIPSASVMLDDGEIERRVRPIRPMEAHNVPNRMMDETHWVETDQGAFTRLWEKEVAEVPEFVDSTILVVSGLLLPIWKRLPNDSTRVYHLQTDDGERIVVRRVSPAWVAGAMATGTSSLTPDDAFMALIDGKTFLDLTEGLQLRRSRVMDANRIELSGFTDTTRSSTKSSRGNCGCSSPPMRPAQPSSPRCWSAMPFSSSASGKRHRWLATTPTASAGRPRRYAATTCPTGGARAATGRWAMCVIRPAGRCSSGLAGRNPVPAQPGTGPMPQRPNMATCLTSSESAAALSTSSKSQTKPGPSSACRGPRLILFPEPGRRERQPDYRKRRGVCSRWRNRSAGPSWKRICPNVRLRLCTKPEACGSTRAATIGSRGMGRPRLVTLLGPR